MTKGKGLETEPQWRAWARRPRPSGRAAGNEALEPGSGVPRIARPDIALARLGRPQSWTGDAWRLRLKIFREGGLAGSLDL
jgi:hypothetical protein